MAGGDHDAPGCARLLYVQGDGGSGSVVVGQFDRDARAGQDFAGGLCEFSREEPRVVADDHTFGGVFVFQDVSGDGIGDAADVVEGEVVGD